MDNLPNEMILKVFKNLNDSDLDNSVEVCDHWMNLIYDGIGVTRFIGQNPNAGLEMLLLKKSMEFGAIEETGLNYCLVGDIPDDQEFPNYRSPHLIKKFSFTGSIGQECHNKLVKPLNNLTCLSFLLATLDNILFTTGLQFQNLKEFKLCDSDPRFNLDDLKDDNLWMNLLVIFLNTHFPKLQVIVLNTIPLLTLLLPDETVLLDALFVFLDKHKTTLKKFGLFCIHQYIEVKNGTIPVIPKIQMTNQLQLQTIQVACAIPEIYHKFNEIVKTQTTLKTCMAGLPTLDPILIQQNFSTIVTIDLFTNFGQNNIGLIDFHAFENCMTLKYLTICAKGGAVNAKCLPLSLESIRIFDCQLNSEETTDLLTKKWTNSLKSLVLHDIGTLENLGVLFGTICTVLKEKRIQRLLINNGMNKNSMEHAKNLTLREKAQLPDLARRILNRSSNNEIKFAFDSDKNYLFTDWDQIDRRFYIPQDSSQFYLTNGGKLTVEETLF